ncbi:Stf0 family sulfotransferase [Sulfuriroseicoccus oceanibius]|uniref:Sulfotransferase n=1 Tax=Sulfuriroseicoccus oceanibius TaxID=2707525 RepID=A0A6B3L4L5_9BACT|nr:Stf0 family sulfotransferase [Sulfuriroseicoccus oceanibius]QQL45143.1 sulfotransferase [Sulfuriroseicoccus oceanibius]
MTTGNDSLSPKITYLVCATHRSGSNLFCQSLWLSELAGYPQECFSPTRSPVIAEEHGLTPPEESFSLYLRSLLAKRQTNGVFGAKIMWKHVAWFREQLLADPQYTGTRSENVAEVLKGAFPELKYFWVRRRDKVRQAISLYKAKQTKIYNSMQEDNGQGKQDVELVYDFAAIDKEVKRFEKEEQEWQKFFQDNQIAPYVVEYENFVEDYEQTAIGALRFLGVDIPVDYEQPKSHYRQLADAVNDEWYARYREDVRKG